MGGHEIIKARILVADWLAKLHPRSLAVVRHVLASFVLKGAGVIVGFVLVPVTLNYVGNETYGIWLALASIVSWFSLFDVGLGHGLRNKLAEALALGDLLKARILVSSTYFIIGCISLGLLLLFTALHPFVPWQRVLQVSKADAEGLGLTVLITFAFFCISFVLRLLQSIFLADQKPSWVGVTDFLTNLISLVVILVLVKSTSGSLLYLALALGGSPIVILLLASLVLFSGRYRHLAPALSLVQVSTFKTLSSLGFKFFLVGITGLVIFSTDNLIIIQLFGPAEVTPYQIAFKYFGLITAVVTIVGVPFWSAYTDAHTRGDLAWIMRTNQQLRRLWLLLCLGATLMLGLSRWFYAIWVPDVSVPSLLSVSMYIYVLALAWGNIFVMYVNGVGKISLQIYVSIFGALINIPLSYLFAVPLGLGTAGIILASTICIGYGPILGPVQFKKLVNNNAHGIWDK